MLRQRIRIDPELLVGLLGHQLVLAHTFDVAQDDLEHVLSHLVGVLRRERLVNELRQHALGHRRRVWQGDCVANVAVDVLFGSYVKHRCLFQDWDVLG